MKTGAIAMTVLLAVVPAGARGAPLTLDEAIARALDRSPTVRAARAELAGAEASARAARGARMPTLSLSGQGGHAEGLAATGDSITTQQSQQITGAAQLDLLTDLGTSVGVGVSSGVSWRATNLDPSQSLIFNLGPLYTSALTLDVRQPLLRGAGRDGALGAITEAEIRARSARLTLENTISQLALDVQTAHRELWYAQQSLRISEDAVRVAEAQADQAALRFDALGDVARTEVLRYARERATVRRARATAVAEVQSRALELGRLVDLEPAEALGLTAATSTLAASAAPPLSRLQASALARSSNLLALRADVSAATTRLRAAENAAKSRLDVFAQAQATLLFDADSLRRFDLPRDRPALSALVGVELELPLGDSQARGERDGARAALTAASASYDAAAQQVSTRIATQRAALGAAAVRIELAREEARAAAELADAERNKLRIGTGTALELLQAQQTERDAHLLYLRALVDYAQADAQLQHDTGALLEALPRLGAQDGEPS